MKKKQVVIATGSAALAAGASKTLELTLNGTGNGLLKKFGKLTAIVTVSSGGSDDQHGNRPSAEGAEGEEKIAYTRSSA